MNGKYVMAPRQRFLPIVAPLLATLAGCASTSTTARYRDQDVASQLAPLAPKANEWNLTDVVPNGQTRPLAQVFTTLHLQQNRIISHNVCDGANSVGFVCFQISPSYSMQVMTGWSDVFDENMNPKEDHAADPKLLVYGIRIRRTAPVP